MRDAAAAHSKRRRMCNAIVFVLGGNCTYCTAPQHPAARRISDNTWMRQATVSASIACVSGPLAAVDAELIIAPWFEDDGPSAIPGFDEAAAGELARAVESKEFGAHAYDLFITPVASASTRDWKARRIGVIGAGRSADFTTDLARRLATAAGLAAKQRRI